MMLVKAPSFLFLCSSTSLISKKLLPGYSPSGNGSHGYFTWPRPTCYRYPPLESSNIHSCPAFCITLREAFYFQVLITLDDGVDTDLLKTDQPPASCTSQHQRISCHCSRCGSPPLGNSFPRCCLKF